MAKIQNLKDMHAQEMDVLQSQIFRLIINLWALTPSNSRGKSPMIDIEQSKLKELESEYRHYEYHEHQYTQKIYNELQSLH
jgi:hypothetical protein